MRLWMLGSGSGGNAVLIECDDTRILVDAGFGTRTLAARLEATGVAPASIQACVLTHEHTDHVKGAAAAAKKWGWSIFSTAGTARARELADAPVTRFAAGDTLEVGRIEIRTARTPHDASDPIGVLVTERSTGARAGICYDIGHASEEVRTLSREVDLLVLEANHDESMLRGGPYPPWLRHRIACDTGHLSNRAAGELARDVASRQLAHVVLAHLSEKNNTPAEAQRTVSRALARTTFRGGLTTAAQDAVVGPFEPKGARRADPLQYGLF